MDELPVPKAIQGTPATEILRVFLREGAPTVSLRTLEDWADPAAWGILLVDIARHVAHAYAMESGVPAPKPFDRIIAGFQAEVSRGL